MWINISRLFPSQTHYQLLMSKIYSLSICDSADPVVFFKAYTFIDFYRLTLFPGCFSDLDSTMLACIAFSCPNLEFMEISTSDTAINRINGYHLCSILNFFSPCFVCKWGFGFFSGWYKHTNIYDSSFDLTIFQTYEL